MTGQQKDGGRKAFFGFIKNKKQEKWLLLLLVGILLLVISFPTKQKTANESGEIISETEADYEVYERRLERRVEQLLGSMEGIGRVKVMVTLEAGSESVLQTDSSVEERQVQETDSSGGTGLTKEKNQSVQTVLTGSGDLPYVVKELTPKVSGIVIMAQGGESPQKASEITAAMEALFGVPAHKIKVLEGVHE